MTLNRLARKAFPHSLKRRQVVSAPRQPGDDGPPVAKKKGWAKAKPKAIKRPSKHRVRRDAKPEDRARLEDGDVRPAKPSGPAETT